MFARVLGPYFAIVAIVVAVRAPDMRTLLTQFTADPVWPWVIGALVLLSGMAIVAFHQFWRGAAAIIVSVMGWLLVARGIFLMAFPDTFASVANRVIDATGVWRSAYVVFALVGLYLTYVGWRPQSESSQETDMEISIDFTRAA
jgi:hypothetical protein